MKPTDIIVLLVTMTLMVLAFTNVKPAIARERRTQMDAGFLSRHSALKNFLNSYDASMEAADPHGPGRRK